MSPILVLSDPIQFAPLSKPTAVTPVTSSVRSSIQKVAESINRFANSLLSGLAAFFSQKYVRAIAVGVTLLCVNVLLISLIPTSLRSVGSDVVKAAEYREMIKLSFADVVFVAPILEELIFRGGLQPMIKHVTYSLTKNEKVASCVAVIATAVLFGAVHLSNGIGLIQVVASTVGGVVFGILKEKEGLAIPILAHMANNFTAWSLIQLLS